MRKKTRKSSPPSYILCKGRSQKSAHARLYTHTHMCVLYYHLSPRPHRAMHMRMDARGGRLLVVVVVVRSTEGGNFRRPHAKKEKGRSDTAQLLLRTMQRIYDIADVSHTYALKIYDRVCVCVSLALLPLRDRYCVVVVVAVAPPSSSGNARIIRKSRDCKALPLIHACVNF